MDDRTYHRLVSSCIDHFLTVLGPCLDQWAEGKIVRWKKSAGDEDAVEVHGRAHWQFEDHEEFRRLFEDDMAAFLREEDCSQADFVAVLRRAHAEGAPGTENLGSLVIETMKAIDDFESFANFMDNTAADSDHDDDCSGCSAEKKDAMRCRQESKENKLDVQERDEIDSNCQRK
ncbi:unnamed protein product [Scytosiphon promiscuus]